MQGRAEGLCQQNISLHLNKTEKCFEKCFTFMNN